MPGVPLFGHLLVLLVDDVTEVVCAKREERSSSSEKQTKGGQRVGTRAHGQQRQQTRPGDHWGQGGDDDARAGAVGRDSLEHELAEVVKLRAARGDVEKPRLGARGGFEERLLDP